MPHNISQKIGDSRKRHAAIRRIIMVAGLTFIGFGIIWWGAKSRPFRRVVATPTARAQPASREECPPSGSNPTPTVRTITVGARLVEIIIQPCHWFRLDPERRLTVCLRNNRCFETTDGQRFTPYGGGDPVRGLPSNIPGFGVTLRASDGRPMQVVFSTWPK